MYSVLVKLYAEYRYERIQDDIRDQYIQVTTKMKENIMEPGISCYPPVDSPASFTTTSSSTRTPR